MVPNRPLLTILLILAAALSACSGLTSQEQTVPPPRPTSTSPDSTATQFSSPTASIAADTPESALAASPTVEDLLYCPEVISADTSYPEETSIEKGVLEFDIATTDFIGDNIYWNNDRFISLTIYDFVELIIDGYSEDGLTWKELPYLSGPLASEVGLTDLPRINEEWYSERPGLGGKVTLITGNGPSGLCLPAPDGSGKQFQLLPFGPLGEYQNPRLIGIAKGTIVLLLRSQSIDPITYPLGNVTLEITNVEGEPQMFDQSSGEEVVLGPSDDGVSFIYAGSGELITELSQDEFMDLSESVMLTRDATSLPDTEFLAWSTDRGLSWTVAKLPGQSSEHVFHVSGAVSPTGTVAILIQDSPFGQLFSPDEIDGLVTEEEFSQAIDDQMEIPIEYHSLRVVLPSGK
jgi:hypothetical protein